MWPIVASYNRQDTADGRTDTLSRESTRDQNRPAVEIAIHACDITTHASVIPAHLKRRRIISSLTITINKELDSRTVADGRAPISLI
jgi:hypothetical protein